MNKVAVLIAAGTGIGAETAKKLASDGFKISILSSSGKGEILAKKLGGIGITGSNQLNDDFSHNDKMDFISCVFEVAFADGELHYLEHHTIKKFANILNLSRDEIINAKSEISNFLD